MAKSYRNSTEIKPISISPMKTFWIVTDFRSNTSGDQSVAILLLV